MSVSRKVLRKIKKVMGVIVTSASLVTISSQVSFAERYTYSDNANGVSYEFNDVTNTLTVSGKGKFTGIWKEKIKCLAEMERYCKEDKVHKNWLIFDHSPPGYVVKVEHVVIGDGITEIGEGALSRCWSVTGVTIPESVNSIGKRAFNSSGITSIEIPGNVKTIGDSAFNNCYNLKEVDIKNGVEEFGEKAFSSCRGLEKFILPTSTKKIGKYLFGDHLFHGYGPFVYDRRPHPNSKFVLILGNKYVVGDLSYFGSESKKFELKYLDSCMTPNYVLHDESVNTLPIKYEAYSKAKDDEWEFKYYEDKLDEYFDEYKGSIKEEKLKVSSDEYKESIKDEKLKVSLEVSEEDFKDEKTINKIVGWLFAVR